MGFGPVETPAPDMLSLERDLYGRGFQLVAGIDEAGRGPLAGPVVAASVILPPNADLPGVKDSKQLDPGKRQARYDEILARASAVGVGVVDAPEIDRINILQATFRAMVLAIGNLRISPDFLLIDGPYRLPLPVEQEGVKGGDRRSLSIAAASIVAKVHRDRLMDDFHREFPAYGFDRNKGYGTVRHLEALRRHGPCPLHRMSFRRVAATDGVYGESNGHSTSKGQTKRRPGR